ncbi:hypothetical protein RJT34_09951 [Clitoria ternatea]|uniref:Uncharacterized protein n=1 Tax=Clitoria ternatea TaxID=43366 RepID=A0AAN9K6B5_CLITE
MPDLAIAFLRPINLKFKATREIDCGVRVVGLGGGLTEETHDVGIGERVEGDGESLRSERVSRMKQHAQTEVVVIKVEVAAHPNSSSHKATTPLPPLQNLENTIQEIE